MNKDNRAAEFILEDAVELTLQALKKDGHIIDEYELMRGEKFPDFWVLDKWERNYLLECKNLNFKRFGVPVRRHKGTRYEGMDMWLHDANWVRHNLLNKVWDRRKLPIRLRSGQRRRSSDYVTITKNVECHPILVITHLAFDHEALDLLSKLFKWRVVTLGWRKVESGSKFMEQAFSLYEQLRYIFTR